MTVDRSHPLGQTLHESLDRSHGGNHLVLPGRRLTVAQSVASGVPNTSHTRDLVLSQVPWHTLLGAGSYDGPLGAYIVTQTGYEWSHAAEAGGTGSGYAQPSLWVGRRTGSAPSKTVHMESGATTGTGTAEDCAIEIPGLLGEVLWSGQNWTTGTTLAVTGPKRGYFVPGALLVALARFKSGGAGGLSAALTTGQAAYSTHMGSLAQIWLYRYLPGSRPGVTFGFARSTACSGLLAIIR